MTRYIEWLQTACPGWSKSSEAQIDLKRRHLLPSLKPKSSLALAHTSWTSRVEIAVCFSSLGENCDAVDVLHSTCFASSSHQMFPQLILITLLFDYLPAEYVTNADRVWRHKITRSVLKTRLNPRRTSEATLPSRPVTTSHHASIRVSHLAAAVGAFSCPDLHLRGVQCRGTWRPTAWKHGRLVHLLLGVQLRLHPAGPAGGAVRPSGPNPGVLDQFPHHHRMLRRPLLPLRLYHLPTVLHQGPESIRRLSRPSHRLHRLLLPGSGSLHGGGEPD